MQCLEADFAQMFDTFPHHQIIAAEFMASLNGGSELQKGRLTRVEENGYRDWSRSDFDQNDQAEARDHDFLSNIKKERQRLRRRTMPSSRSDVKPVEIEQRLER